jgi:tRNA dimethylallyltransferase
MRRIITIIGPTASGKTSLAIRLSKQLNAEVIGLDSRQIYKGMSIGTAQPTIEEMDGVKHHLIGFQEPSEPISAGEYSKLLIDRVKAIRSDSKVPIICGGAGLYYRAISKGIFKGSTSDLSARHRLEESYDNNPTKLLDKLRSIDPEYAELVHLNNKKRLVRALEIFEVTGKTPSENFIDQRSNPTAELDLYTIQIKWTRNILNERIMRRTDAMLNQGWIRESGII